MVNENRLVCINQAVRLPGLVLDLAPKVVQDFHRMPFSVGHGMGVRGLLLWEKCAATSR